MLFLSKKIEISSRIAGVILNKNDITKKYTLYVIYIIRLTKLITRFFQKIYHCYYQVFELCNRAIKKILLLKINNINEKQRYKIK